MHGETIKFDMKGVWWCFIVCN